MGSALQTSIPGIAWAFIGACLALLVILFTLGAGLVIYQRRFVRMHREYADGLIIAQENERAWVAREIHDDTLQRILVLMHEVDSWTNGTTPVVPLSSRVEALRSELEDLSASLRQMAYRLHPSFHSEGGLMPMLERLAGDLSESTGLNIQVRAGEPPPPELDDEQSLVVYRIAQEALANVVRHAGGDQAILEVSGVNHSIQVRVTDNGAGFDAANPPRRGLGLISMMERARSAGGMLSLESQPGGGTRVQLKLPVRNGA
jgi:signal transduction histidine kinase